MKRKITCPELAHLVDIEYSEDPIDGRIIGVLSCSAFEPCNAVDCDEECIRRLNRKRDASEGVQAAATRATET